MVTRGGSTTKEGDVDSRSDVRTSLVIGAVRGEIAADQDDFTVPELRLAAHLHRHTGEMLSAMQYEEKAEEREEVDVGT